MKRVAAAACLACAACQPAAFPRTAEVAAPGRFSGAVHFQAAAYEPQRTVTADGRALRSDAAFFPIVSTDWRYGVKRCEVGGVYAFTRALAEVRCGILQERLGAPFSLAASGAMGVDYGPYVGPVGRVGLDLSVRFGPLRPLVDVYLSTANQGRYMEDPGDPPVEGPLPGSKGVVRYEVRVTVPFGVAIQIVPPDPTDDRKLAWSLLLGATAFTVLHVRPCTGCIAWHGDDGVGFVIGLEAH
jgi:hypothetical protein